MPFNCGLNNAKISASVIANDQLLIIWQILPITDANIFAVFKPHQLREVDK